MGQTPPASGAAVGVAALGPEVPADVIREICSRARGRGWSACPSEGASSAVVVLAGGAHASMAGILPGNCRYLPVLSSRESSRRRARRRFLLGITTGLALLLALSLAVPVAAFRGPPGHARFQPEKVPVAAAQGLPPGQARQVRLAGRPVLVQHSAQGGFFALDALCSFREACPLYWEPARDLLVCPCHGDESDLHGNVLRGPATRPLPTHLLEENAGTLFLRRRN